MTRPACLAAVLAIALAAALAQAAETPPSAAPQPAAVPLVVHYNERPPQHYTERGAPRGPAIDRLTNALNAARIPYQLQSTPAKQQLVILQANKAPACMLGWVDLPGRSDKGKLSEKIYEERRLWCTKATLDETMQRIDAALRNAALIK